MFKAQLKVYLGWEWDDGAQDKGNVSIDETFEDGTGVDQAEAVYHVVSETILDGNSNTYDLTALLRQVLGDELSTTLVTIKELLIINESTSGNLVVGNAAADEWSEPFGADGDTLVIRPDSPCLLSSRRCGWEIDGSNKNLKIAASGDDVTFSMVIIGLLTPATGVCSSA